MAIRGDDSNPEKGHNGDNGDKLITIRKGLKRIIQAMEKPDVNRTNRT
jgi:hypothetical protein